MDNGIGATQLIDLVGDCTCPSDGRKVPRNNAPGTECSREGVATSTLISPVQYNVMTLVDQEPGRHESESVR